MADLTPEQQQEHYAAIELLYSEGNWNEVLAASKVLLDSLPPVQGHPLRPRLDLVIGHTLLYGLADPPSAEQWYRTVLLDTEETVLREIAEQGLVRCNEQQATTEAATGLESQEEAEPIAPSGATASEAPATAAGPETTAAIDTPSADATSEPPSGPTVMPWETAAGQKPREISDEGASGLESSAAMPWLAELGIETPAPTDALPAGAAEAEAFAAAPVANPTMTDSIRKVEPPHLQAFPQEVPEAEAPETNDSSTTDETLAWLRKPDDLIPVTVQVLDETQPLAQDAEPAREEPPLSAEEMTELARGLLEVILR